MIDYKEDLLIIRDKIKHREKFSFSKYADGEYAILRNQAITNCDNWTFLPDKHQKYHQKLLESFTYNQTGYYVGISCPCCVPQSHVDWMRKTVTVPDSQLTWANLFVNANHNTFMNELVPLFDNYDLTLVANQNATIINLPFKVNEFIGVTNLAWVDNYDLLTKLKRDDENRLYLFSAGPLGNMLAYELWKNNQKNTYIDIGSTLNHFTVGRNRGYLLNNQDRKKICRW